jgi:deazaflavin-dependent oxidoreductase (nitroreductase family)
MSAPMAAEDFRSALQQTQEIDLTVTGRRSGNESTRPIWFVEEGDRVLLLPVTGTDSNWYRNIKKDPEIKLAADGAELDATAKPTEDATTVEDVVEKFRQKYGAGQIRNYYSKTDVAVEVPLG